MLTYVCLFAQIIPVIIVVIALVVLFSRLVRSEKIVVRYITYFVLFLIFLVIIMSIFVWGNTYSISISPDGEIIAITSNRGVWMYSLDDGKKTHHVSGKPYGDQPYQGTFSYIEWSPDGSSLAVGKIYNGIWVWDVNTWELLTERDSETSMEHLDEPSFAWSPDGKQLVLGTGDGEILIWDKETDVWESKASPGKSLISITWTSDNEILMLDGHNIVNVETGDFISYLDHWIDGFGKVSWSNDGSHLYVFFDLGGGVMDVEKNEYEFGAGTFPRFAWSFDGRYFASVIEGGNEISVWDIELNQIVRKEKQGSMIDALAWTPNNELLASGVYNGKRLLWNTETGEEVMKMNKFFNSWPSLIFGLTN